MKTMAGKKGVLMLSPDNAGCPGNPPSLTALANACHSPQVSAYSCGYYF